jgi:ABC-type transporter Mla subunit MlaD
VSAKSDRQAARDAVAAYHGDQLAALVERVAAAIDRFRASELDAFDVDQALYQYSRAAKELWRFCNLGTPEIAARIIHEHPAIEWWERGAPRRR